MRRLAATIALVLVSGTPAKAACVAPPGTAAVDQYCELVQGPTGEHDSATQRQRVRVPPAAIERVTEAGPSGEQLLAAVGAEAARPAAHSAGQVSPGTRPATPKPSVIGAVRSSIGSGPQIAAWFLIGLILICGAIAAWRLQVMAPRGRGDR